MANHTPENHQTTSRVRPLGHQLPLVLHASPPKRPRPPQVIPILALHFTWGHLGAPVPSRDSRFLASTQGKRASAQQLCLLDSSFFTLTLPRSSPIRRGSGQPSCRTQRHFLGTHRDPSLGQGLVHPSTSPLRLTPLSCPLTPGLHCTFSQVWNWRPKGVAAPWSKITQ